MAPGSQIAGNLSPLAFTGLDAAGKETGQGTDFAGYLGGCR